MQLEDKFISDLLNDIEHNRIVLPTLPEVALKVRKVVDDPNANVGQIAKIVATDAALSARLIQVANSPLLRGRVPVDSLPSAIARLGNKLMRNLVTSLLMEQLHQSRSPQLQKHLKSLWVHSTEVAAISHVLAAHFTTLKPDEALLAGLIHDIGALPILARAQKIEELMEDSTALNRIIAQSHTRIGKAILEAWEFPPELIAVPELHEDLQYTSGSDINYVEVVIVANLQSYIGTSHPHATANWGTIPAFAKLGINPEVSIVSMEQTAEEVKEVQRLLTS
ncbi:MAG TPA: HDOD domain-containing protein [Gammaproteobacteria bacterium]|nr:HDOD domain-containing protein [Gammaproteobacteria bacterium]